MKRQRVQMILQFSVATEREQYGYRQTELPLQRYAEHDMGQYIKDIDEIPDCYRDTVTLQCIRFEWKRKNRVKGQSQTEAKAK